MTTDSTIDKARYIFSTGKLIHDRIIKIQNQCLATCEEGECHEMSVSQLHMLRIVRQSGELTMSELAERMEVSPPSASAMVDRLVEKGVLSREHSTQDRRKVVVRVSPEAVIKAESIEANIMQLFIDLVDKLGPETAQKWCDVLACVKIALSEEGDSDTLSTDAES